MAELGGLADPRDVAIGSGMSSRREKQQCDDHGAASERRVIQCVLKQRFVERVFRAGPTLHGSGQHLPHIAAQPGLQLVCDVIPHLDDLTHRTAVIDEHHGGRGWTTGHDRSHAFLEDGGDASILRRGEVDQGRRHPDS